MIDMTGARVLYSDTEEAKLKAEKMYNDIRRRYSDCYYVSKNTEFSIEQCQVIKNYIFNDSHILTYGFKQFSPDYAIARSWLRLSSKSNVKILKHDIMLLYHELTEIILLLNNPNMTQIFAHNTANMKYDYSLAVKEYEKTLK